VGRISGKIRDSVYADDVMVLAHHEETQRAVEEIARKAENMAQGLKRRGPKIEPKKSDMIELKEKKRNQISTMKIQGVKVKPSRTVR